MIKRLLNFKKTTRSFFLFGARGTGKTTLLSHYFNPKKVVWIDLLDPELEARLDKQPTILLDLIAKVPNGGWVVIDEIQKIPQLLNLVHKIIQSKKINFALTGSSARKLKRGGANLLAGRASWFELFPLMELEIAEQFNLKDVLHFGSLPEILFLQEDEKIRYLRSYCHTYLKEEVLAEQLIRKAPPFRNFLELLAIQNGQILNYANFARDVSVEIPTIQTYVEILVDTLVGFEVLPFSESIRKRQRKNPKFYFFDIGVTRALSGELDTHLTERTSAYGRAFEHFIVLEIYRMIKTYEKDWGISYLQTKDSEVDLIIECSKKTRIALEIKSTNQVHDIEVRKLERIGKDILNSKLYYVSQDKIDRSIGAVRCLHWKSFLSEFLKLLIRK